MSMIKSPKLTKLEDEPMWLEACSIAEDIYAILHTLPEDEKWNTTNKLKNSSNDLLYYSAQALANSSYATLEYDWSIVRKNAGALKTMYRFAGKLKFIDFEPEMMVRLDALLSEIDKKVIKSRLSAQDNYETEIAQIRKKYVMWKEMNA